MNKREPKKQFARPSIIQKNRENNTENLVQIIPPESKKDLERVAIDTFIESMMQKGHKINIIEENRENPDFVIEINDKVHGLELCELFSPREARVREVNKIYESTLKSKTNSTIKLKLLPKTNKPIPDHNSVEGLKLIERMEELMDECTMSNYGIIEPNMEPGFWIGYHGGISYPVPLDEDYKFWETKLTEKWNTDYTVNKNKSFLLIYRTEHSIDIGRLKESFQTISISSKFDFEQVWLLCIKPMGTSILEKVYDIFGE
jgi:hypothetical protein